MFVDAEEETVDFDAACGVFAFEDEVGSPDAGSVYSVAEAFGS